MGGMKAKTPLKAKKPLKGKPLRAKQTLKQTVKKKRRSPDSIPMLRKKADAAFSRYIRIRDSECRSRQWIGECITCNRQMIVLDADGQWNKAAQHGHFIGRGNHWLRYSEENGNLQCAHCNAWRDKESMLEAYRKAVDDKYGTGTFKRLKKEAKDNERFNLKKDDYRQVIEDSTVQLDFYLKNQ